MRIKTEIIRRAFDRHFSVIAAQQAWDIDYHVQQWLTARSAFENHDAKTFESLYWELHRRWQIFRGAREYPDASTVFDLLSHLPIWSAELRLSRLTASKLPDLWNVISAVGAVKKNKTGPSVMAISKFLHFWNPRLFIIVDDAMMWRFVFSHSWLWEYVDACRVDISKVLGTVDCASGGNQANLADYITILWWAAGIVRSNRAIAPTFAKYVQRHCNKQRSPADLKTYEGAAIEWFLLGLVEIPPIDL